MTHPIIDAPMLAAAAAAATREGAGSLLVVDLGVPRNVEPAAASLDGVELLDMEDLRAAVADALSGRREEVTAATEIVAEEVERFRDRGTRSRTRHRSSPRCVPKVEAARRGEVDKAPGETLGAHRRAVGTGRRGHSIESSPSCCISRRSRSSPPPVRREVSD